MSDEAAFLRAICEEPDDDTPRLVFADWLEEHNQPERAELIRVQCERARGLGDRERRTQQLKRQMQLVQQFGRQWFVRDWPDAGAQAVTGYTFDRGFVDTVSMVRLGLRDADVIRMTESRPLLALVRRWHLSRNRIGDDGLRAIAGCPRASRLVHLSIVGNPFTIRGLEALAESPHLVSLVGLSIGYWRAPGPCEPVPPTIQDMYQATAEAAQLRDLFRRHGKNVQIIV